MGSSGYDSVREIANVSSVWSAQLRHVLLLLRSGWLGKGNRGALKCSLVVCLIIRLDTSSYYMIYIIILLIVQLACGDSS